MTDPTNHLIRDVLTAMGATPPTDRLQFPELASPADAPYGGIPRNPLPSPTLDLNDLERRRALLQELWEDADARLRMYGRGTSERDRIIWEHLAAAKEYAGHALDNARWALEEAQAEATARGEEW